MRARLLIVDDHVLVRQGVARLLGDCPELEIVGEAGNGHEAIEKARVLKPDLILMDRGLPELDGLEATATIARELPDAKVIILTVSDNQDDVYEAFAAGAKGYLLKTTDHMELVSQIRQAESGQVVMSPAVANRLAEHINRRRAATGPERASPVESLTEREKAVLALVGRGLRNKEIAAALFTSANTTRGHIHNLMRKLGLENRAQLAIYAVQHHLT